MALEPARGIPTWLSWEHEKWITFSVVFDFFQMPVGPLYLQHYELYLPLADLASGACVEDGHTD